MNPEIEAALARLEPDEGHDMPMPPRVVYQHDGGLTVLDFQLAALIRSIAAPEYQYNAYGDDTGPFCVVCGQEAGLVQSADHTDDCCLLALVRAINGGTTP